MVDMSYLVDKPIAVLGSGNAGRTMAIDCTLAGKTVHLYEIPDFSESVKPLMESRQITLTGDQVNLYGFKREGTAQIAKITTDMAEVVKGCGLISFCIPANGFQAFFEKLIPHLEYGMVIHFTTGNYGSLILCKMMREAGCTKEVIIGEWSSLPYGTRTKIFGGVKTPHQDLIYRAITLRGSALPTHDNDKFFESVKYFPAFDSVVHPVRGDTVIDIALTNVNPVLHVPGTLLGVGAMENFGVIYGEDKHDYAIYSHAYCPSISRVQLAFYKEQQKIASAMGVGIQGYEDDEFFSRTNILGAEFMGPDVIIPFEEQFDLFKGTGPFTVFNRYITEDVPVGCHICHELGKKYGVETPTIDSMIHLASIVTQENYFEKGWTLAELGIANLSKEETLKYLHDGIYPD